MRETQRPTLLMAWLPVSLWLGVIAIESTVMMGAGNTSRWLLQICHALWGQMDDASFEETHFLLRKLGHLCGYGLLSVFFYRAWFRSLCGVWRATVRQVKVESVRLAVACTFVVACMDEWHQSYLPGRTSSVRDVLIDTFGAALFTMLFVVLFGRRKDDDRFRCSMVS